MTAPTPDMAAEILRRRLGRSPIAVSRFATGIRNYVYEARFQDHAPLVVRIGDPAHRGEIEGGVLLSHRLRPLGVPLPELIVDGSAEAYPFMVLERLAGTDLGAAIGRLPPDGLDRIAVRIARAQGLAAALPSAGRFGYAATPEAAPYDSWFALLSADIGLDLERIDRAGVFDADTARRVAGELIALRPALEAIAATPFLHDTTTKNVIVGDDGELSGIVDVDLLCFGDPRLTPALTLASLMATGGAESYVTTWMQAAGLADDRLFRFYVARCLVSFMAEHGRDLNGNLPVSDAAAIANLETTFHRAWDRLA